MSKPLTEQQLAELSQLAEALLPLGRHPLTIASQTRLESLRRQIACSAITGRVRVRAGRFDLVFKKRVSFEELQAYKDKLDRFDAETSEILMLGRAPSNVRIAVKSAAFALQRALFNAASLEKMRNPNLIRPTTQVEDF